MRKRMLLCLMALAIGLICVACGGSEQDENGEYRFLYSSEVSTLNYLTTPFTQDYTIAANIEDALVDYDQYGNLKPGMADSWESNENMTEWTFHLKDGLKWVDSEGKEVADVTANDWVAAAHYVNNAANGSDSQYMYNTGAMVTGAQAYYDYTYYMTESKGGKLKKAEDGTELVKAPEAKAEDIGVIAKDDKTLVYKLDRPCAFFPSITAYSSFMPVNQEYLDKWGDKFASDKDHLLYCGGFVLAEFKENGKHVLKRNESYWDRENVHIATVTATYDKDMAYHEPYMFMKNEVDYARITDNVREEWMNDSEKKDQIHTQRPNYAYSYFYCFNFDPNFDAKYEPENWKKAVNSENFRQSIMAGMDRVAAIKEKEPYNPEVYLQNTITPTDFASAAGKDYTQYDALKDLTDKDYHDQESATAYREKAQNELKKQGVQFPVKVLMPYNPAVPQWREECYEVEKQLEQSLGKDYIDIIVEAGPESSFLEDVRRSGKYAFMKCNWGADYVDPETWTQPFGEDGTYMFWSKSKNATTQKLFKQYAGMTDEAFGYYKEKDLAKRYDLYAKAERLLIDHAVVIPFSSFSGDGYVMSRVNEFEAGYAPCAPAAERYKYMHVMEDSMSQEEFDKAFEKWKKEREESLKENS